MDKRIYIRWIILSVLLVFIWTTMALVDLAEWYARHIYPGISGALSRFSTFFPFSLGDVFIVGSIVGLLAYIVYGMVKRKKAGRILRHTVEYLLWIYVWFYMAWGLNYFRHDFYTRAGIQRAVFSLDEFKDFLGQYTDSLHAAYIPVNDINKQLVGREVKRIYPCLPQSLGLTESADYLRPKPMLSSALMSKVGVKGYLGPFFTEFNLNSKLPPVSYPNTYAHEMAHVLGITGEAEANLYAYLICTASDIPEIRFSGYYSVLTYVIGSAKRLLPPEEYRLWIESLSPEIRKLYNDLYVYWESLYDPWIGEIQDRIYNLFLKGNNITDGTGNYSQVIGLMMSLHQNGKLF